MSGETDRTSLKEAIRGLQPEQVLEAIDNGIDILFGSGAGTLVFKTLERIYNLDKDAIPSDIERFDELLDTMFGKAAIPLRKRIVSELERKRSN